jgi:monoamine oxidase
VYFAATEWKTIDKGLNRLAEAFHPIVDNRLKTERRIERLSFDETTNKTGIHWRTDGEVQTCQYDKTLVAVPFSVVRMWRTPTLNPIMTEAIKGLNYDYACKISVSQTVIVTADPQLLYKTRFWEHIDNPIYGGCGATDLPGVGSFCYPAYNINGTGPGALLASYSTPDGLSAQAMPEEDHVQMIVEAMNEIHGPIAAEQYTGVYNRQCWGLDRNHAGSWASPEIGQHERYMPEYHKTHANHIFIGEHTSINHAWIFSALESAVRGVVQLLLDDGLVDEAQEVSLHQYAHALC